MWTLFIPRDSVISDSSAINISNYAIFYTEVHTDELTKQTEITTSLGNTYAVENNDGTLTVGGFPVTEVSTRGISAVYVVDGELN